MRQTWPAPSQRKEFIFLPQLLKMCRNSSQDGHINLKVENFPYSIIISSTSFNITGVLIHSNVNILSDVCLNNTPNADDKIVQITMNSNLLSLNSIL